MLAVTKVLLDDPLPSLELPAGTDRSTAKTISDVRRVHAHHWKCLRADENPSSSLQHTAPGPRPLWEYMREDIALASSLQRTAPTFIHWKRERKNLDGEHTPRQRTGNNQPTRREGKNSDGEHTAHQRTRNNQSTISSKRKRKDSDGEYTPHQRAGNNQSTTSAVRRASKRLATSRNLEQQLNTTTIPSWSITTKRSSSSTSALTSASSSSFDRLPTPGELDTSDLPAPSSKSEPKRLSPDRSLSPESDLSDTDDFQGWEGMYTSSVKIGFPSREKKMANDSTLASHRSIEVGVHLCPTPVL